MSAVQTVEQTDTPPREEGKRRGRSGIVILLVISLVLSAVLQQKAFSYRNEAVHRGLPQSAQQASARIANLDSFSLALLLGGLRGPLVMFLWPSSERQKSEKDLDSFDTKVEMIRLLQAEYDTVHLFQMWNKAYNISVQLASLSNKYAAILDAIEYGQRIDRQRPYSVNILSAIGGLYSDKLGGSQEKEYYRRRVRTETLPVYRVTFPSGRAEQFKQAAQSAGVETARLRIVDNGNGTSTATLEKLVGDRVKAAFTGNDVTFAAVTRQSIRPESSRGRPGETDTLLDASGNLLPQYLKPLWEVPAGQEGNNGAELQYLEQFQPFSYGISPVALGYNYHKRSQILQRIGKQKHIQLSEMVVNSQPAITLRLWAEEEWDRGRRLEERGLARAANQDALPRELRTAAAAPDIQVTDRAALDEAIFSLKRSVRVADASLPEYEQHMRAFPSNMSNYASHMDTMRALAAICSADAVYLEAIVANKEAKPGLLAKARSEYELAAKRYLLLILKYYTDEEDAAAGGYNRAGIDGKSLDELKAIAGKTTQLMLKKYKDPQNFPSVVDRQEYEEHLTRIDRRLAQIK